MAVEHIPVFSMEKVGHESEKTSDIVTGSLPSCKDSQYVIGREQTVKIPYLREAIMRLALAERQTSTGKLSMNDGNSYNSQHILARFF